MKRREAQEGPSLVSITKRHDPIGHSDWDHGESRSRFTTRNALVI
jgi:hypothetical protein